MNAEGAGSILVRPAHLRRKPVQRLEELLAAWQLALGAVHLAAGAVEEDERGHLRGAEALAGTLPRFLGEVEADDARPSIQVPFEPMHDGLRR